MVNYYKTQVNKPGVKVTYMKEANAADIVNYDPDLVVPATGSNPVIPKIEGIDRENVCTAVDVLKRKRSTSWSWAGVKDAVGWSVLCCAVLP